MPIIRRFSGSTSRCSSTALCIRSSGPIKDRSKERTILLDYDDNPHQVYDADDFRWRLYFKRNCVDRETGRVVDYAGLPILPTAYCAVDAICEPPPGWDGSRSIDVACLYDTRIVLHANCPVLVGISDGPEYASVKRYLLESVANYFIVPPIMPAGKVQNGCRFEQYRQWLRDLDFRYALMLDLRDVYFRRDPFADAEDFMRDRRDRPELPRSAPAGRPLDRVLTTAWRPVAFRNPAKRLSVAARVRPAIR
jgi:hypothetical protein